MTNSTTARIINGIDTEALQGAIESITAKPEMGMTRWSVSTRWKGGTRSDTHVQKYEIGGESIRKDYTIRIDEPLELCGTNQFANPQEYLMAALNACMMVGYAAVCAMEGIELEDVRIETRGDIDLRGFLGIDSNVKPGYDSLQYDVYIKGSGTPEQFQRVHETVAATSPNFFNLANAIPLKSRLIVE